MLLLRIRRGGYAFVYHRGVAIGAILIGQMSGGPSWVPILFSGTMQEFEILRPEVVARRYGEKETRDARREVRLVNQAAT